jgi:hypothetical protein
MTLSTVCSARASQAVSRYHIGPARLIVAGTFGSLVLAASTILQRVGF